MKRLSRRNVLALGAVAGTGAAIRFEAPTLFTGAYPGVHGIRATGGLARNACGWDPVAWLLPK